jgi:exopolysaccharide production protein ExoY
VFFRHERIGLSGRPFDCLKFRTMVVDADKRLAELLADPQRAKDFAEKHKLTDDPRITRVGTFLRKSNLDELPQLLNVLRGEMSIVGPRPIVLSEVPRYGAAMSPVLRVRPGLTGLWQVSGRNDLTYTERVVLDLRYVNHRSLRSDVAICARTAQTTARGNSGAY